MTSEELRPFGENWADMLDQDEFWVDYTRRKVRIDQMLPTHAENALRFIIRKLPGLVTADLFAMARGPQPSGDVACDAFDSEMSRMEDAAANPEEFVRRSPLGIALERRSQGLWARSERPEQPEEGTRPGGRSYSRRPQQVTAIRYDGSNYAQIVDFVNDRNYFVEETMISGPGPLRGMQKAVVVRNIRMSVGVPVGHWLVVDDVSDEMVSLSDGQFTKDYQEGFGL